MPIATLKQSKRQRVKKPKVTPTKIEGYDSIRPYKTQPTRGSVAHQYLKFLYENKDRWVMTKELHHIYHSEFGTHINYLIRLAKSGYIYAKKEERVIEYTSLGQPILRPIVVWQWKISPLGIWYVEHYARDLSIEEIKERVIAMAKRNEVPYSITDDGITLLFTNWRGEEDPLTYRFEDLRKPRTMRALKYNFIRHNAYKRISFEKQVDRAKLQKIQEWLSEHPELKTKFVTPIGVIELKGNVEHNWVELDGKRVCIVPAKRAHVYDAYVTRLLNLNYKLEEVMRILVKQEFLKECTVCGRDLDRESYTQSQWRYCPFCGSDREKQVDDYIKLRISQKGFKIQVA